MGLQIRSYEIDDEQEVVDLWNQCLPYDAITSEIFEEKILLDPNFDLEGCKIAKDDRKIVGFIHTVVRKTPFPWGFESLVEAQKEMGWIIALFVHEGYRRRGIGSALLNEAFNFLRDRGRRKVLLFSYTPNYFFLGVDIQRYPGALEFFEKHGFVAQEESFGMGVNLYNFKVSSEIREAEERLTREGITVRYFERKYLLPTISFFLESFPTWLHYFVDKLERKHDLDEMVIALKDDKVIGYCQHRYYHHMERTGPFGVKEEFRGREIGTVMLYKLLERMAQKGYKFGWFTETGSRAKSYYARAGYEVTRRHVGMVKEL